MSADSASVQFVAKSSLSASLNAEAALSAQLGAGAAVVNDYLIQTEEIEDGHRLTITRGSEVQTFDLKNGAPGSKDAVIYTPQILTTEQQAQARENVGAASAERVEAVENALPGKLSEPAEGLAVGKYFRVAAIDENGHAVLEAVDAPKEGLAITPTGWPAWTADEQAAARERLGEFTDVPLAIVADVTLDEAVKILNAQLSRACRFVVCTFIIPPEDTGTARNIYYAANWGGAQSTTAMFTRSQNGSTNSTMSAFYLASALIVGGKILSFGCIAGSGEKGIEDFQTRVLNNPPNGYCVLDAESFKSISVYTYGNEFPTGSRLIVTGC